MTAPHTISEIIQLFRKDLQGIYSANEIRNLGYIISGHLLNYSKIDFHLNDQEPISDEISEKFLQVLARLKNREPVQYITGIAEFYGLNFKVDRRVLIPRPETEELADWIIRENKVRPAQILDIGTGSGCIAVSLALNLPEARVSACDVSEEALELARVNAKSNNATVNFFRIDLLDSGITLPSKYQVMVSNPPYVRIKEKALMQRNVLDFEPELALFVHDEDPLLYYRNIALLGRKYLEDGGKIYFEINESFPSEVVELLKNTGFYAIEVRKDVNGKSRMVRGMK